MKRKSWITMIATLLTVAVLCATCVAIAACDSKQTDAEYIMGKKTLICGITLYEPMNYADDEGEMTGFDTEFAEAVCAKLGIQAKFQVIKWSSKEIELNGKYIDCIWNGFTVNDERKENIEFTKSYLNNSQCIVVKKADLANYTTEASLAGKKGTAESGSAGESTIQGMIEDEKNPINITYTEQTAQMSALTDVVSGNSDFAVVDVILANAIVGNGQFENLAIVTAIQLEPEEYAIGFRKGSDMAAKVNAVIDELLQDGTLETLAKKYKLDGQLIK